MIRTETQPILHNKSAQRPTEKRPAEINFDVNDPVGDYLRQLQEISLLTPEEEIELATHMHEGKIARQKLNVPVTRLSASKREKLQEISKKGFEAAEEFILKNRRLVVSIAKHRLGRGLDILDLIQEGNIGLIRATKKFDVKRGCKFSSYATWWIRQAIDRAIAEKGRTIRIPVYADDRARKIMGVSKRLTQELGREPTVIEIAAELPKMTAKEVKFYQEKDKPVLSLQMPTDEHETAELGDSIPDQKPSPAEQLTQNMLKEHMERVLNYLPPKEARILKLRFGLNDGGGGLTLEKTGQKMGITRERVRQLQAQALDHLRRPGIQCQLKDYLNKDEDR